jgi:hypothetical protein
MNGTNHSTAVRPISTNISAPAEGFAPGQDLYDTHFEDFVVVREVYDRELAVECKGRLYRAPVSQFERLSGDVRRTKRMRMPRIS